MNDSVKETVEGKRRNAMLKKMMSLLIAISFLITPGVRAEYSFKFENPRQEKGANLIVLGATLLLGGIVSGKQARSIYHKEDEKRLAGVPENNKSHNKASLYAGGGGIGLFLGVIVLAVGFNLRF